MSKHYQFDQKNILVTGGSGGIGTALVHDLRDRGASIVTSSRAVDLGDSNLMIDLRSEEACVNAIDWAKNKLGRLDAVINCVGVVAFGEVENLSSDAMEELFLTNVFIPILLFKSALPSLEENSLLVNISGVVAEKNFPGMATYGASKAAAASFVQGFAREARRKAITVIDARPPHTETGLATRPVEGTAPAFPKGLNPQFVAKVIGDAIEAGKKEIDSSDFTI